MSRLRLFAVAAAVAAVAGLASAGTGAAAPAAAPGHAVGPHHPAPSTPAPAHASAVQWTRGADGKVTGLVHYTGGLTAHIAPGGTHQDGSLTTMRAAARRAVAEVATRHPEQPADPADQGRISGRVVDAEQNPLAGVEVDIFQGSSDGPIADSPTNANGYYDITLAAGDYFIGFDGRNATGGVSDATGYVPQGGPFRLSAGEHLVRNPQLRSGAMLRVRVTDTAGNPLAGVAPYLQPVTPYAQPLVGGISISIGFDPGDVTAADGTLALRGLPTDAVVPCFGTFGTDPTGGVHDALGYGSRCARHPIALAPRSITDFPTVELNAASGGAVRGVVATAHGHPVANAVVEALGNRDLGYVTTTDAGSYRITGLAPGKYRLCAVAPAPAATDPGLAPSCTKVVIRAGKVLADDVTLHRGGAISGTVTGPSGTAVAGALVFASGAGASGDGITDADGNYIVTGLPTGSYRVCVDPSGAVDAGSPTGDRVGCYQHKASVAVQAGSVRAGIDLQLRVGGAIAGRVTGVGGAPAPNVDVDVEPVSGTTDAGDGETDVNGNYLVTGLAPGTYQVCFFAFDESGGGDQKCEQQAVEVSAGATTQLDESLAPATPRGSIVVSVRDEQGRPVQGVDVGVLKPCPLHDPFLCESQPLFGHAGHAKLVASQIDGDGGRTVIGARKPGKYAVCLFAYYGVTTDGAPSTGYTDRCAGRGYTVTVRTDETTHVHLTLHPGGRVEGKVVDPTGRPVTHAQVQIAHSAAADYVNDFGNFRIGPVAQPSPQRDARTNEHGMFTIRSVRPGAEAECVQARPRSTYVSTCADEPVTVTAEVTTHAPNLVAHRPGAIAGTVRDARRGPVKRAFVGVFTTGSRPNLAGVALVDEHGRYRVVGLSAGRYIVCFIAPHRSVECYDQVHWNMSHRNPPERANKVRVSEGHTTTGIDAELPRRK